MEKIPLRLLEFIPKSDAPLRVLVTEGEDYLRPLRAKLPNGIIAAAAAETDCPELYTELGIELTVIDIYSEPLPFDTGTFDYIIGDLTLERAANPQDIAAGFGTFLKPTGAWITSFRNIRHWSVLADIMDGHYYNVVSRLYAKQEFERLMYASFYKEVRFRPVVREDPLTEKLTAAGFSNVNNDMNTEFWLAYAARSMPELSLLKSMYDEETRKELSRIIHRIEYGVDTVNQCAALWSLRNKHDIIFEYLADFIAQTTFYPKRFYDNLTRYTDTTNEPLLRSLLDMTR